MGTSDLESFLWEALRLLATGWNSLPMAGGGATVTGVLGQLFNDHKHGIGGI